MKKCKVCDSRVYEGYCVKCDRDKLLEENLMREAQHKISQEVSQNSVQKEFKIN